MHILERIKKLFSDQTSFEEFDRDIVADSCENVFTDGNKITVHEIGAYFRIDFVLDDKKVY